MDNSSSPLDTLRQLKEMLDAGALTPTEFEALKQRLVFNDSAATPSVPPVTPAPPTTGPAPASLPFAATPAPVPPAAVPPAAAVPATPSSGPPPASPPPVFTELRSASLSPETSGPVPPMPPAPPVATHVSPLATPAPLHAPRPLADAHQAPPVAGPPSPGAAAPAREPLAESNAGWAADEFPESETTSARSPLALILSIGGLLALLGLVVYLALNRPPSERISSTSLTAADSVAAPIETGPQVEPVQAPVALPETVRVRPANPAPAVPARPRPAPQTQDSVSPSPATATDSVSP